MKTQVQFYRIDELKYKFNIVKINGSKQKIVFVIPKKIKYSDVIAKHVTNSLIHGDMGSVIVGFKRINPEGIVIKDEKKLPKNKVANYLNKKLKNGNN